MLPSCYAAWCLTYMDMHTMVDLSRVTLPKLTLRNEDQWRQWYTRLQEIARSYVIERDHLARLYAAALKRGIDLSHIMTADGALMSEDVEAIQQELMRAIADDVELVRMLISIETYPRRGEAIRVAIEFLRDLDPSLPPSSDAAWEDVPYDDIAAIVESFFRAMR